MKIKYISDLHIDFWIKETNPESRKFNLQMDSLLEKTNLDQGGDVLIIAGDLGHYFKQDAAFLLKLKTLFNNIILVRGNHDMYLVSKTQKNKYRLDSNNRVNEMKEFCLQNNIYYLDGDVVEIDGIKFGGVGMSWDDSFYENLIGKKPDRALIEEKFKEKMNDPRLIYGGVDNYSIQLCYSLRYFHSGWDQLAYFESELNKLKNISDVDVMVTHYSPKIPENINSRFEKDLATTFYFFNGESQIERLQPKFWVFGHTHENYDFVTGSTRFLCNPLGYPNELNTKVKEFEIV